MPCYRQELIHPTYLYLGYKSITIMDGVKFKFNDINYCIGKMILSEDGQSAYDMTKYI